LGQLDCFKNITGQLHSTVSVHEFSRFLLK
jgi:hypothetical protein